MHCQAAAARAKALPNKVPNTPTPTDTTVKTTGEKILINDSTLGEIWITELANVPKNTLDKNNFSADANFKYYNVNGKAASTEGVDVSDYNGTIDWKKS